MKVASLIQVVNPSSKSKMFSKRFFSGFMKDSLSVQSRSMSIVRLFETPLQEVKVVSDYEKYTVINIDSYSLEEQVIIYPVVLVHTPVECPHTVIDVE